MGGRLPRQCVARRLVPGDRPQRRRRGHWDGQFLDAGHCRKRPAESHRQPSPDFEASPGSAEKLVFCQYVSRESHPGRRLCTNRSARDEPKQGSTRLMRTGIVGSNPCGVIRDISSAAAARFSPSRSSSLVWKSPPPPRRRRSRGDAQERPYAARFDQEPQCGERSGRNESPAGARAQAQTARWLRAGGQRDRTLAVGADRGPLRIVSIPAGPLLGHRSFIAPRAVAPCPGRIWPSAREPAAETAERHRAPARNLRNTSGL